MSDIVARHESTTAHALGVLKAASYKAAENWVESFPKAVKRGDHRPMRDALIATGVVAPDPQHQGVTVIIGTGAPATMGQLPSVLVLPDAPDTKQLAADVIVPRADNDHT